MRHGKNDFFYLTMILTQPHQRVFLLPGFQKTWLTVLVVLLFSALAGIFIQMAFQQFCATRLGIILLSGMVFWTAVGPYLFDYAATHPSRWHTLVVGGVLMLVLNQVFIYFSISFLMAGLYGCVDSQNNWLHNILTNNIVINALCYTGFVGAGLLTQTSSSGATAPATYVRELTIKHGSISTKLPLDSVYWIEADDKCIALIGEKCRHVLYRSLKSIEAELDPVQFVRIHRGTVVNKAHIQRLHSLPTGDALAEMTNGTRLKVSRNFKRALMG